MATLLIDDHLLRGVLAGRPARRVCDASARGDLATTGLYYHRLCLSVTRPGVVGRLSAPIAELDEAARARFRGELLALRADTIVVPIRELAWRMAELRQRFPVSTLVAEALAAGERLEATIAVDEDDLGPQMSAAAHELGVPLVTVRG